MKRLIRWLFGGDSLGFVPGWNQVRAEQAAADTERLLLGAAVVVSRTGWRWSGKNGCRCDNCGHVLTQHESQRWCPQ